MTTHLQQSRTTLAREMGLRSKTRGVKTATILEYLVCAALVCGVAWSVEARTLARPGGRASQVGSPQEAGPPGPGGPPGILSGFGLQAVQQFGGNVADFPAISTAPGLTFRYDPGTQFFERASTSLGPVFVERARTVGRGRFEFGFSYLYINYTTLNGDDIDGFSPSSDLSNPDFRPTIDKLDLSFHLVPFFATYGITDRWDVNILFPLIASSFNGRVRLSTGSGLDLTFAEEDDSVGGGDIFLRTKYRLYSLDGFNLAVGSALRFPAGDEDESEGKGTIFEPFVAVSQEYGRFDLHLQTGIEVNFDDSDRSRVRYAGGVAADLIEQLALTIDIIGSSNLKTDRFVGSQSLGSVPSLPSAPPVLPRFSVPVNTDIVDLALGLKGNVRMLTGFVTFFVPITDDGLRADFIPAVGLLLSF